MTSEAADQPQCSIFDQSPMAVVRAMLREHDGMDPNGVTCLGCGEELAEPTGSWPESARVLHRHQWAVMGFAVADDHPHG